MSETPESTQVSQQPEPAPDPREQARKAQQQRNRQRSVIFYIFILFAAAFVLLGMSLMMEQRQNAEDMDDLTQSITGLKDSVSAMQSVQTLYEENAALLERIHELEQSQTALVNEKAELTRDVNALNQKISVLEQQSKAMDWFWQIDEAFVLGRWNTARELVTQLEESGLRPYLPQESITDNGRFSPRDRLEEICDQLY